MIYQSKAIEKKSTVNECEMAHPLKQKVELQNYMVRTRHRKLKIKTLCFSVHHYNLSNLLALCSLWKMSRPLPGEMSTPGAVLNLVITGLSDKTVREKHSPAVKTNNTRK